MCFVSIHSWCEHVLMTNFFLYSFQKCESEKTELYKMQQKYHVQYVKKMVSTFHKIITYYISVVLNISVNIV